MAMQLGHVHIKTREDPQKVAKFYIDNFGATVKREIPGRGCQLDLHGVQLKRDGRKVKQRHCEPLSKHAPTHGRFRLIDAVDRAG